MRLCAFVFYPLRVSPSFVIIQAANAKLAAAEKRAGDAEKAAAEAGAAVAGLKKDLKARR